MHPTVLAATAYALLLSSFVTLAFLLRKGCSRRNKSPFCILSTSDVLSAALTSIALLVNHIEAGIRLSYDQKQNGTSSDDHTWTIEENSQFPFLQIRTLRETELNATLTCDMKGILMQYGISLAALTNAFVSLLTLILQCNFDATRAKRRCASVMKSLANDNRFKSKDVTRREGNVLKDEQESASRDNIGKNGSGFLRRIMKASRFPYASSEEDRPAKFFVTSHWLVPFLVVATLYFAEYNDMNTARYTEDAECVFESNFPMNDFYIFSNVEDNLKIADFTAYATSGNGYPVNWELSSKIKPSDAEVDEVVLKVRKIVASALNYTRNSTETDSTESTNVLASSGSQTIADYAVANDIINYIKMNIVNMTEGPSTLAEQNASIRDESSKANDSVDFNRHSQALFHHLLKNASEELEVATFGSPDGVDETSGNDNSYREKNAPARTEESQKFANLVNARNKTLLSNNQIYHNIIKRIQAAGAVKSYSLNRLPRRSNDSKDRVAKRKPNTIQNLFSSKNDDLNRYISTEMQNGTRHMINECLISTKFLQLHLFVLSVAIYFLPILLSCVLQVRGRHTCKITRALLRARTDLAFTKLRNEENKTVTDEIRLESPRLSTTDGKGNQNSTEEESKTWQEARNEYGSGSSDIEATRKDHKDEGRKTKDDEDLLSEIDCTMRIFKAISLSLILCTALWTPMLLGTLLRVFSCIRAPQWLTDATFLSAISFGIVRNLLNMYIIKTQEICDVKANYNRIHPIK